MTSDLLPWRAEWISAPDPGLAPEREHFYDHPAPLLRKEFEVRSGPVVRARVHAGGLGYYEVQFNGRKVGDEVLSPGWTNFSSRVALSTFDVTARLRAGRNAIGAMLGNGWYNPAPLRMWGHLNLRDHLPVGRPRLIVQLEIEYADGSVQTVVSDKSWTVGDGPVLRNSIYLGEVHDARREQAGWDEAGFDDTSWKPADIAGGDVGPLRRSPAPPVRVMGTLSPVAIAQPRPGVYVFDLGENFTGWARLRTRGSAGTRIMMRFGELLYPDGSLNAMTSICGQIKRGGKDYVYPGEGEPLTAFQSDTYVLRGAKEDEVYTPRFTFHAFRYVEVTGLPHAPKPDTIQGLRLHADVKPVGSFSCSNDLFNRIEAMTRRTMLSNLISVQSDCPHRERFGYGGDIVVMAETFLLHFDMAGFYAKAVEDLADAARENGGMTETAPYVGIADESLGSGAGPVGWGTAFPMLQWHLYQYHGNVELLREHYDATRRWVDLLASAAGPGLVLDNGIGDHESVVEKPPKALTGTAFFFLNATLFSRIARSLGRADDATRYADLAARIRTAFNARFLQAGTGRYGPASQASQAFALFLDLVPPDEKQRAFDVLLADIDARDGHLSTGIFGTRFLLLALSALGRADVAFHIANKTTYPSWGHMLERGATTLWEHWSHSDDTFSHNHPMFGTISEWFVRCVAGINPAPDAVGFDKAVIRPHVVGDLTWAEARHETTRGPINVRWDRRGNGITLRVVIPTGTSATVNVPGGEARHVGPGTHTFVGRA